MENQLNIYHYHLKAMNNKCVGLKTVSLINQICHAINHLRWIFGSRFIWFFHIL